MQSTLMNMLSGQMRYMTQRQKVLADNIANLDTPGYKANDLKKLNFSDMAAAESSKLGMARTQHGHISGPHSTGGTYAVQTQDQSFEISPNGNSVVLEEQMAKISDTGAQYQISSSLFRKFHGLYRTALGNR